MTLAEVVAKADELITEVGAMPAVGYSNYKELMVEYRRILNDLLVLIRETAKQGDVK